MLTELSELGQVKQATAIVFACLAKALADADPAFKSRFAINLDEAYARVRELGGTAMNPNAMHDLELISWTHELVTGHPFGSGPKSKPFFPD
jgi:hypothetical protein